MKQPASVSAAARAGGAVPVPPDPACAPEQNRPRRPTTRPIVGQLPPTLGALGRLPSVPRARMCLAALVAMVGATNATRAEPSVQLAALAFMAIVAIVAVLDSR